MRTTVTLDADTEALIRKRMRERGVSFKRALNDAIREALAPDRGDAPEPFRTYNLGAPTVNLDKALQLAAELEDEDIIRKMRDGA